MQEQQDRGVACSRRDPHSAAGHRDLWWVRARLDGGGCVLACCCWAAWQEQRQHGWSGACGWAAHPPNWRPSCCLAPCVGRHQAWCQPLSLAPEGAKRCQSRPYRLYRRSHVPRPLARVQRGGEDDCAANGVPLISDCCCCVCVCLMLRQVPVIIMCTAHSSTCTAFLCDADWGAVCQQAGVGGLPSRRQWNGWVPAGSV